MKQASRSSSRGFTLIELMMALCLGVLVTGCAVKLYSYGVDATWVVEQRAELQQDLRAAETMLLKDISLAGAGLTGISGENIPLPSASGSPTYGCSAGPVCPPNGALNYPTIAGGAPTLYPIMPGFARGITPPGGAVASDIITVVYTDTNLALNCYSGPSGTVSATNNAISFNATGNVLTFTAPTNPPPASCVLPTGLIYPQALNNTANGLQAGDLVMVGPNTAGTVAVGEVTAVAGPTGAAAPDNQYVITFANGDTLNLNQSGQTNDLTALAPAGGGQVANLQANRIFVITYYLKNWTDAAGNVTTILYRQVNGQAAVPLVDNVANMQFTYDTYNSNGTLLNASGDGGESLAISPNLIRKVNIMHVTVHGQLYGTRSALMATQGFQSFDVQTSISARNMSYNNRY
jgi:prepilin-type N-terminal cleavage/methylation domain-containing protein